MWLSEMEQSCVQSGFLGKNIAALEKTRFRYQVKFAQIIEFYDESDNLIKRVRCNHNLGVASFRLFDDIQIQEWMDSKFFFFQ